MDIKESNFCQVEIKQMCKQFRRVIISSHPMLSPSDVFRYIPLGFVPVHSNFEKIVQRCFVGIPPLHTAGVQQTVLVLGYMADQQAIHVDLKVVCKV